MEDHNQGNGNLILSNALNKFMQLMTEVMQESWKSEMSDKDRKLREKLDARTEEGNLPDSVEGVEIGDQVLLGYTSLNGIQQW